VIVAQRGSRKQVRLCAKMLARMTATQQKRRAARPHTGAVRIRAKSGDVPVNETLSAYGKTLAAASGVPEDALKSSIGDGKVIRGALV
jgi:hypothetical protein